MGGPAPDPEALSNEALAVTASDDGVVLRATIDRPKKRNAINADVIGGLHGVLETATHALVADQLEDMDEADREQFVESMQAQYEEYIDIRQQAAKLQVDELLPAGDLREQLVRRLRTFADKRRTERDRHHGTVLF